MKRKIDRRKFLKQSALASAVLPIALRGNCWDKVLASAPADASITPRPLVLWFDKPASEWVEALPVGNGRLGAMVFGGSVNERLQLNEDTLYAGGPYDPNNTEAVQALPEAQRLIFAGKYKEASDLIGEKMMAHPIKQMPYEPVGDLLLGFPGHAAASDFRRELDLDTAIARVSYTAAGIKFNRESFSSPVDQVIVVSLVATRPGQINFHATMATPQQATVETTADATLVMRGRNGD